jgi:hypothetical protein
MSGMTSQLTTINRMFDHCTYDIVVLTETWLRLHHLDPEIASSGWQINRFDRPDDGRGGGVLIAVKSSLPCNSVEIDFTDLDILSSQQCWMKIKLENNDIYLGNFYLKPNMNTDCYIDFINLFSTVQDKMSATDTCFIFGDFNLPGLKWEKVDEDDIFFDPSNITTDLQERVLNFFAEKGLGQICNLQNRAGNVLDLVFTNALDNIVLKEVDSIFNKTSVHHKCFDVKFLYAYNFDSSSTTTKTIYDYENANYERICQILQTIDLDPVWSIDHLANDFIMKLTEIIENEVPKKSNYHPKQSSLA